MSRLLIAALMASCGLSGCGQSGEAPTAPGSDAATATAAADASAATQPAPTQTATPQPQTELTCSYPVDGAKDTAASLLARYGASAKRETLPGPEGTELSGIVLWPKDPSRRVEAIIDEDRPGEHIGSIRIGSSRTVWKVAGIGMGTSLDAMVKANGRPIRFWGFGWDYGGRVSDLGGGRLAQLTGGCTLSVRLNLAENDPKEGMDLMGDSEIGSDEDRVKGRPISIDEFGLYW